MAGNSYGVQTLSTVGRGQGVSADGRPIAKVGGVTVDWSTVAAASPSITTLVDGTVIPANVKHLERGQILTMIGVGEVQTITFTGGPTGGSIVITLPASGVESAEVATAVAYNASAVTMQNALTSLSRIGPQGVTVTRSGAGSNADPYIYTLTFARELGNVPTLTSTHTFTGGTSPTGTHATSTSGGATDGQYGPYDPSESDGRQTIENGWAVIVGETILETDAGSAHPLALVGGAMFADRIKYTRATASLAYGPTLANFRSAFPAVRLVTTG